MNQGSSTAEPGVREPEEECEKPDCLYSPVLCPVNEGVVVKIMSDRESGLLKAGEYFNVCDKFLMGRCQKNSGCLYYHTLLPFYWQIFSKENCSWCSLSFRTQLYLEMLFSSPGYFTRVSPKLNDATSFVDMVLPTFYLSCDFQHNFYRRIPCRGDSSFPPIYILYWFNGQVWSYLSQKIPHETPIVETQKLESTRSYGSGALSAMASGHPSLSSPSPLLMYWLKYIPLHELIPNIRIWNLEKPKDLSIWDENALDSCLESYSELSNKVMIPREKHFLLMEMLPSEPAYQYCCRLFFCSMNCKESAILRIFRLYNPKLWKKYKRGGVRKDRDNKFMRCLSYLDPLSQKAEMVACMASFPPECHLFHETAMSLEQLAAHGLKSKLSSYNGILGYGTYFSLRAETASLMNWSHKTGLGHIMVLAKVLVGEMTMGQPGLLSPPLKPDGQQFDSCVNNTDMPTFFAVFKKKQSYPNFIIVYKHAKDPFSLTS